MQRHGIFLMNNKDTMEFLLVRGYNDEQWSLISVECNERQNPDEVIGNLFKEELGVNITSRNNVRGIGPVEWETSSGELRTTQISYVKANWEGEVANKGNMYEEVRFFSQDCLPEKMTDETSQGLILMAQDDFFKIGCFSLDQGQDPLQQ